MLVYADWEFLEDGKTIDPISVGMVREDGAELYYEFIDAPWGRIAQNDWLMKNVIPGLSSGFNKAVVTGEGDSVVKSKLSIRMRVYDFLLEAFTLDGSLELWGWYSAYDHVCLAKLFGKMINLPDWCPMLTLDLKQEFIRLGITDRVDMPKQLAGNHNAIEDARHIKRMHEWFMGLNSSPYEIHIRDGKNIQLGSGNVQHNVY